MYEILYSFASSGASLPSFFIWDRSIIRFLSSSKANKKSIMTFLRFDNSVVL
jgi:hypothetical protein